MERNDLNETNEAPTNADSRRRALDLGYQYLTVERPDLAEPHLRQALVDDPNDTTAHGLLALTLYQMDRTEEAWASIEMALAVDPTHLHNLSLAGNICHERGDYPEAETYFLTALQQYPDYVPALHGYASLMHVTGHEEKAAQLNARALELDPDDTRGHLIRSHIMADMKDHDASASHSEHALRLDPDRMATHMTSGVHLIQTGHPFQAREHFRQALRLDPANKDIEEIFLETDRNCRWIGLPFYHYSLWVNRIPGKQFTIWGLFVLFIFVGPSFVPAGIIRVVTVVYLTYVVYSWTAPVLTKGWARLVPPRL